MAVIAYDKMHERYDSDCIFKNAGCFCFRSLLGRGGRLLYVEHLLSRNLRRQRFSTSIDRNAIAVGLIYRRQPCLN